MNPILIYLVLSAAVLLLLITTQGIVSTVAVGPKVAAGTRDDLPDPLPGFSGRMSRMVRNHVEGLVLAIPVFLFVLLTPTDQVAMGAAILGARLFFIGRVSHAILYLLGVPWLRTLAFTLGLAGLIMMAVAVN